MKTKIYKISNSANNFMLRISNKNTITRYEQVKWNKLTITAVERWRCSALRYIKRDNIDLPQTFTFTCSKSKSKDSRVMCQINVANENVAKVVKEKVKEH